MSSIEWVDRFGAASLSNHKPGPASRFFNWTPDIDPIGPARERMGTGRIDRFSFRDDDLVSFEIRGIPGSELALMRRLKLHLMNGGLVTLTTDDFLAELFATCTLGPGTKPKIDLSDRKRLLYTFGVTLRAASVGPSDLLSPAFVPGLKLWLDADDLTITNNDEDFISYWPDKSGNGNHAVQATSNKQPRIKFNQVNGHAAVEFASDANPDALVTPTIINPATIGSEIFLVAKRTGAHVEHGDFIEFAAPLDTSGAFSRIIETHSGDARDQVYVTYTVGGPISDWYTGVPTQHGFGSSIDWFVLNLKIVSNASIVPYYNGIAGTAFNPADDIGTGPKWISVGGFNGQVQAVLQYEGLVSSVNRNRLNNLLLSTIGRSTV